MTTYVEISKALVTAGYLTEADIEAAGVPAPVSLDFQRSDENFHGDNKFMRIASFEKGQRLFAMMLHALVGQPFQQ